MKKISQHQIQVVSKRSVVANPLTWRSSVSRYPLTLTQDFTRVLEEAEALFHSLPPRCPPPLASEAFSECFTAQEQGRGVLVLCSAQVVPGHELVNASDVLIDLGLVL